MPDPTAQPKRCTLARKALFLCGCLCLLLSAWMAWAHTDGYHALDAPQGLTEAGIYLYLPARSSLRGILVLANGYNNTDGALCSAPNWRTFAKKHRLALVEIAFASTLDELSQGGHGYYYPQHGSGKLLLDALDEHVSADLPIYLFGFSGGGHFVSRFQAWAPQRVAAWAAYAVGWWDEPQNAADCPPGIILCGDGDSRFDACRNAAQARQQQGQNILWQPIPDTDHKLTPEVIQAAQKFLEAQLEF